MKKERGSRAGKHIVAEVADEYRFDYRKSKSNRFAGAFGRDAVVVVLDPDVARVFRDSRQVNAALRAKIAAVKKPRRRRAS